MEEAYKNMGTVNEDEDILFDKNGFKKSKSKSKKKSKKSNNSKKITGCGKYSNKPLKCLAKGCNYSDATKKCTPSRAPKKLKPKSKRILDDGKYGDFAFAMADDTQLFDPSIPLAQGIILPPISAGQPKVAPSYSAPKSPKAKKPSVPSRKQTSPTTAYRNARKRAIDNDQLQFIVDGRKFSRKSLTTIVFQGGGSL
jgi:hypothetical protein